MLMPYVPDMDESSEDEGPIVQKPIPRLSPEELFAFAQDSLELMKTLYLHNHQERQVLYIHPSQSQ